MTLRLNFTVANFLNGSDGRDFTANYYSFETAFTFSANRQHTRRSG